jgi:hypothetical protein
MRFASLADWEGYGVSLVTFGIFCVIRAWRTWRSGSPPNVKGGLVALDVDISMSREF